MTQKDSLVLNLDKMVKKTCVSRIVVDSSQYSAGLTEDSWRNVENPENSAYVQRILYIPPHPIHEESKFAPPAKFQDHQYQFLLVNAPQNPSNTLQLPRPLHLRTKTELDIIQEENTMKESISIEKSSVCVDGTPIETDAFYTEKRLCTDFQHSVLDCPLTKSREVLKILTTQTKCETQEQYSPLNNKKMLKLKLSKKSLKIHSLAVEILNGHSQSPRTMLALKKSISPKSTGQNPKLLLNNLPEMGNQKYICLTPRQSAVKQRLASPGSSKKGIHLLTHEHKQYKSRERSKQQPVMRRLQLSPNQTASRITMHRSICLSPGKQSSRSSKKIQVKSQVQNQSLQTPKKRG